MLINLAVKIIISLILLRYGVVLLGYIICFLATKSVRVPLDETSVRGIADLRKKRSASVQASSRLSFASHIRRYVNGWFAYSLLFTGRIPSHWIRNFLYRYVYGVQMGAGTVLYRGSEMRAPYNIAIGQGTIIGDECKLDGRNGIIIGKNVNFSTGVWIWTDQHDPQCPDFSCTDQGGPVIIRDRVWVSCRAVILPRVTIGEGAVVAAGAVVTRDVEPFAIYAGVPARKIGERNRELAYEFNEAPLPFY